MQTVNLRHIWKGVHIEILNIDRTNTWK